MVAVVPAGESVDVPSREEYEALRLVQLGHDARLVTVSRDVELVSADISSVRVGLAELRERLRVALNSERLDALEALSAPVEDEEPAAEPPPDPTPPTEPEVVYGHREEPRTIDATNLYPDRLWQGPLVESPIDRNGQGFTVKRSDLPYWNTHGEWNGRGLYHLTVENDVGRQVAVYAHEIADSMDLIDVAFRGFGVTRTGEDRGHVGVVDVVRTRRMRAINIDIDDAAEHGLEARGEVRGGHVRARQVAYAGNPRGADVVEDIILEWLDTPTDRPDDNHWGAMKSGGDVVGATFTRVIFRRAPAWTDLGAQHIYIDCQWEDSPGRGAHHEVGRWVRANPPPLMISYGTFRHNTHDRNFANRHWFNHPDTGRENGGDGNPSHVQAGHITAQMGTVLADHCLIELDVTTEVGWAEWADNGKRAGMEPPSGVEQTSDGSRLFDSKIVITYTEGEHIDGLLAAMQHPEWNRWDRVVIEAPRALASVPLVLLGNDRRLTIDQFLESRVCTDCRVIWTDE